jgi:flagellar M-ring protein FliF
MATNEGAGFAGRIGLNLRPLLLLLGIAAAVAVGVTVVLWWRGPNWSLLYGNLSDADASSVVQALQTASIEYKLDSNSGAIMVPAERVHEARLQLAGQGLPQGKSASLELMSKDPGFGVSQFMENARYQYALEGELARTIASLQAVEAARIHLALPQQSAFVRDRRPASASVLLQLRAGHRLQAEQVSAIVHLVASSIPELDSDNVTVVDQQGRLLSSPRNSEAAITAEQFEAAHRIEDNYTDHIERLIAPLVGEGRVHAQVTVDLDSGATEEAHEQYKPDSAIVRSEQSAEEISRSGSAAAGGVPGALTNQPPAGGVASVASNAKPAAAPAAAAGGNGSTGANSAAANAAAAASAAAAAAAANPESTSKQMTRNYEIDRTVSYSRQPAGRVKRVTVAVLVDNVRQAGADGKSVERALTQAELDDITRLVKDAVGFDQARGDSVNVVNQPFLPQLTENIKPEVIPLWQRPWVRDVVRLVLGALVLVALALGVLRPLIKNLSTHALSASPELLPAGGRAVEEKANVTAAPSPTLAYEQQLVQARGLVSQDPKRVAQVVKTWVGEP